jgi:hypothetical protein
MAYQPVDPFFMPGAPPPPLPLLTCQTDLSGIPNPKPTITVSESLSALSRTKARRLRPANRIRSPSPYTKPPSKGKIVMFALNRGRSESQESDLSELSELSDFSRRSPSESCSHSDGGLILKPLGEVSRPNRGGYNLERALNWDPKTYTNLQASSLCFANLYQIQEIVVEMCPQACRRTPQYHTKLSTAR